MWYLVWIKSILGQCALRAHQEPCCVFQISNVKVLGASQPRAFMYSVTAPCPFLVPFVFQPLPVVDPVLQSRKPHPFAMFPPNSDWLLTDSQSDVELMCTASWADLIQVTLFPLSRPSVCFSQPPRCKGRLCSDAATAPVHRDVVVAVGGALGDLIPVDGGGLVPDAHAHGGGGGGEEDEARVASAIRKGVRRDAH